MSGFKSKKIAPFVVVDTPDPVVPGPTTFLPVVSTDMGGVGCADPLTGGDTGAALGLAADTDLAIP